jgi:hypothetical protein
MVEPLDKELGHSFLCIQQYLQSVPFRFHLRITEFSFKYIMCLKPDKCFLLKSITSAVLRLSSRPSVGIPPKNSNDGQTHPIMLPGCQYPFEKNKPYDFGYWSIRLLERNRFYRQCYSPSLKVILIHGVFSFPAPVWNSNHLFFFVTLNWYNG